MEVTLTLHLSDPCLPSALSAVAPRLSPGLPIGLSLGRGRKGQGEDSRGVSSVLPGLCDHDPHRPSPPLVLQVWSRSLPCHLPAPGTPCRA